jgi:hypothetical protein
MEADMVTAWIEGEIRVLEWYGYRIKKSEQLLFQGLDLNQDLAYHVFNGGVHQWKYSLLALRKLYHETVDPHRRRQLSRYISFRLSLNSGNRLQ